MASDGQRGPHEACPEAATPGCRKEEEAAGEAASGSFGAGMFSSSTLFNGGQQCQRAHGKSTWHAWWKGGGSGNWGWECLGARVRGRGFQGGDNSGRVWGKPTTRWAPKHTCEHADIRGPTFHDLMARIPEVRPAFGCPRTMMERVMDARSSNMGREALRARVASLGAAAPARKPRQHPSLGAAAPARKPRQHPSLGAAAPARKPRQHPCKALRCELRSWQSSKDL